MERTRKQILEIREQDDKEIANWIDKNIEGETIGDLGCGDGKIINFLRLAGRKVYGIDSKKDKLGKVPKGLEFECNDLSWDIYLPKTDIIISFEVAEHLPLDSEDIFIKNLVKPDPKTIVMSVATLGQEADSHFNIKPRRMWIDKIEEKGYNENEALEYRFKKELDTKIMIKSWISWNIMIFNKK